MYTNKVITKWIGILTLVLTSSVQAQELSSEKRVLGIHRTQGSSITIQHPYAKLRRTWWQFLKEVGRVTLHRKYWEVETNRDVILYANIIKGTATSKLYLGIEGTLSTAQIKHYSQEISNLLHTFATLVHKNSLITALKACEKELIRKSIQWDKLYQSEIKGQDNHTQSIQAVAIEMNTLTEKHASILQKLAQLE